MALRRSSMVGPNTQCVGARLQCPLHLALLVLLQLRQRLFDVLGDELRDLAAAVAVENAKETAAGAVQRHLRGRGAQGGGKKPQAGAGRPRRGARGRLASERGASSMVFLQPASAGVQWLGAPAWRFKRARLSSSALAGHGARETRRVHRQVPLAKHGGSGQQEALLGSAGRKDRCLATWHACPRWVGGKGGRRGR